MPRGLRILIVCLCLVAAAFGPQRGTVAAPRWAAAATARIHPGIQLFTKGSQCTSNFVFYDAKNRYIGQAAHCASKGLQNETNGCRTATWPVGTKIEIPGASRPGILAYSSWSMMQHLHITSDNLCYGNDFALIRIDPADWSKVNPTIPHWGGPSKLGTKLATLARTYTYGNSELRGGLQLLSPHSGFSTGDEFGGWTHGFYTIPPGIFGDSGSAVLGPNGEAIGVLSTLSAIPPLQQNASDLAKDLAFLKAHTSLKTLQLATGTTKFAGGLL